MSATTRTGADSRISEALSHLAEATAVGNNALVELDAKQLAKLKKYLELLLLWRSRMALISTADPVRLVELHIVDSLHLAPYIVENARVADIGSGAGLPGIPLAVARPQAAVTLIESKRKKANFLREARRLAELGNVEVIEGRAEDCVPPQTFDAIVSRALGRMEEFLSHGGRLLVSGGVALAMRGPDADTDAIQDDRFEAPAVVRYGLADGRRRTLLIYRRH